MAERRMMSKSVIETDAFMDMPFSTQALYFHLLLRADDDGFIKSPKAIMRFINARDDDMKLLIAKQYVLAFDSGVIVIKHWKIHNYIRSDRYKKTDCIEAQQVKLTGDNEYTIRQNGMSVGTPSGIPDGRQVVAEADIMFNSALIYELSLLKKYAVPMLNEISQDDPQYQKAQELLDFCSCFRGEVDESDVPNNSILREFIGGSVFFK